MKIFKIKNTNLINLTNFFFTENKENKSLNKYFAKYERYLHILSHENDCYTMLRTRREIEQARNATSDQDEILKTIRETMLHVSKKE